MIPASRRYMSHGKLSRCIISPVSFELGEFCRLSHTNGKGDRCTRNFPAVLFSSARIGMVFGSGFARLSVLAMPGQIFLGRLLRLLCDSVRSCNRFVAALIPVTDSNRLPLRGWLAVPSPT